MSHSFTGLNDRYLAKLVSSQIESPEYQYQNIFSHSVLLYKNNLFFSYIS